MSKAHLKSIFPLILAICFLGSAMDSHGRANRDTPQTIDKIYFLIHPLIYEPLAGDPATAARFKAYIEYERTISPQWFHAIAGMRNNEALVVGAPGCPMYLEKFVKEHLGSRGLIIRDDLASRPDVWKELSPAAKEGLGHDLLAMFWKYGFAWTSDPLGQPVIARGWAERVKNTFRNRGLAFDPNTVQAEGWGESFEGCVANYGRYLGTYLGLSKPIEDNFEMTVPDAPFLLNARLLARFALNHNVRLYLWKSHDGSPIASFLQVRSTIGEPSLFAEFPLGSMKLVVRSKTNRPLWPKVEGHAQVKEGTPPWEVHRQEKDSTIMEVSGKLKIPIPTPSVDSAYIFSDGVPLAEFRAALLNAVIIEER